LATGRGVRENFRHGVRHVRLSGDRAGECVGTEERPDGSLTLVPDTSFEAIRKRLGTEPGTLADFEAEYGPVKPLDGEG
jgi:hypothetical protein